jgi:hypothetical protein
MNFQLFFEILTENSVDFQLFFEFLTENLELQMGL